MIEWRIFVILRSIIGVGKAAIEYCPKRRLVGYKAFSSDWHGPTFRMLREDVV